MFSKGGIIEGFLKCNKGISRRIVQEINDGTYLWEYPELPSGEDNIFWSGNSSDPKMEFGWKLKTQRSGENHWVEPI